MGTRRPFSNVVLLPRRTQMNLAWQWHHDSTAAVSNVEPNIACEVACEQAHLRVTRASDEEQSDPAGRSLVKRCQESEPALISVIFSFLLRQSEVKYHWSKNGKGAKTVNLLCLMRSD